MKVKGKGLTSLTLVGTFLVVATSGTALYLSPKGRVANWTGWTLGGLSKHQWEAVHLNVCILMLGVVLLHLFFNWRVLLAYIRQRSKGLNLKVEMAIAVAVTTCVVVGTIYQVPPMTVATGWGERIKAYWENNAPAGPAPHAEEMPLGRFAHSLNLMPDDVMSALQAEGIEVAAPNITLAAIAAANATTPQQLFTLISKRFPAAASTPGQGGPGGGWGRGQGPNRAAQGSEGGNSNAGNHDVDQNNRRAQGEQVDWAPGSGMGMGRGAGMGRGRGWQQQDGNDAGG